MEQQCASCGASLVANASFCGKCGRTIHQGHEQATHVGDLPTLQFEGSPGENDATIIIGPPKAGYPDTPTGELQEDSDEEEKRRRAALLGLGLPLLGELANQQPLSHVPTIQGTPQMAQVPTIQGTPQLQGGASFGANPGATTPGTAPFHPHPIDPHPISHPPHHPGGSPGGSSGSPGGSPGGSTGGSTGTGGAPGCLVWLTVIVATVLLIISSFIGLGLTVWAPSLSLGGSSIVAPGGTMSLHGSSFLPNSSVTLTLDGGAPLYFSQRTTPAQLTSGYAQYASNAELFTQALLSPTARNVIAVHGDGTFALSFLVDSSWTPGRHTIHATEAPSHRNASLLFTIAQQGTTATPVPDPTDTPTDTPGVTPTATPTLTPTTPPSTPPGLSCASPGSLALGPISELSSRVATGNVTLCANGFGTLHWSASWDQNAAPWLQVNASSGTIQAPNQFAVTVRAAAAGLKAGTYNATITFIGQETNTTQTVHVTLTVQAGCVQTTTPRVIFSGAVANVSNPSPNAKNISITNCGLTSNWSARIRNGGGWLSIAPGTGTLNGGATGTITATASSLRAGLKAGTYTAFVDITIGSQTISVTAALTVQPQPLISAKPTTIDASACENTRTGSLCTITLINSSSILSLLWSWSSATGGVSVQSNGTTIPVAGTQSVTLFVPVGNCTGASITFTFRGPGSNNAVNVVWTCSPIV